MTEQEYQEILEQFEKAKKDISDLQRWCDNVITRLLEEIITIEPKAPPIIKDWKKDK